MSPAGREPTGAAAAFFDFDDTIINTSAGRLFGRELVRLRWRRALDKNPGTLGWAVGLTAQAAYFVYAFNLYLGMATLNRARLVKRSTVVRTAYRHLKGWPVTEVESLGRDYFDDVIAAHIYPQAVEEMQAHRDAGRLVVVATTNMRHLVDNLRRYAPVDHVIGAELEARDGRLTGRSTGPAWGEEKAHEVRAWAHKHNVSLPRSHAYSDHYSDHPFLALVGRPHIVNGDVRLRRMARRKQWATHRWRLKSTR